MNKIGRNDPCPCGSGKKYKRCCEEKEAQWRRRVPPSGRFRYEPGSYGGPNRGDMPSILCYKEIGPNAWTEHFCLVKPDAVLANEDRATAMAQEHLAAAARDQAEGGGDPREFALSLRHDGYKSVSDYRIVKNSNLPHPNGGAAPRLSPTRSFNEAQDRFIAPVASAGIFPELDYSHALGIKACMLGRATTLRLNAMFAKSSDPHDARSSHPFSRRGGVLALVGLGGCTENYKRLPSRI